LLHEHVSRKGRPLLPDIYFTTFILGSCYRTHTVAAKKMETLPKSFHARSLGPIVRVQGRMTAEDYRAILRTHLLPYWRRNNPGNWVFQQDNDPTFWGCFHFFCRYCRNEARPGFKNKSGKPARTSTNPARATINESLKPAQASLKSTMKPRQASNEAPLSLTKRV
jgi:hypothetical protein